MVCGKPVNALHLPGLETVGSMVEFRILGTIEGTGDQGPIPLGGPRQRTFLAALIVRRNEVVSIDRLVDDVWGEAPPPTGPKTVQVYVSQLRKAFAAAGATPSDVLETHGHGYRLVIRPGELDVDRFERLLSAGRAALAEGNYASASATLGDALAVWRGPALEDVGYEAFAREEIGRLEERRLAALEDRVEADLHFAAAEDLVGELEMIIARNPLRERPRGQLMRALYRAGRHGEALNVYAETRRVFSEELGIEPGPTLRDLERKILAHDPELVRVERGRAAGSDAARGSRFRHRRVLAVAAPVVAIAGVAVILALVGGEGRSVAVPAVQSNVVAALELQGGLGVQAPIADPAGGVAAGRGAVWASDPGAGTVERIDPTTGDRVQSIRVGRDPTGLAIGAGAVWVANSGDGTVSRIDPQTYATRTIRVGNGPGPIAFGDGKVWVANVADGTLQGINPVSLGLSAPAPSAVGVSAIVADGNGLWASVPGEGEVIEFDPRTGKQVTAVDVGNGPTQLTLGGRSTWVTNPPDDTITEIDPALNVRKVSVPGSPVTIAWGDGDVWVATASGTVARVDPVHRRILSTVRVGGQPGPLAFAAGRLWVGAAPLPVTRAGGTLQLAAASDFYSLDPATAYDYQVYEVVDITHDGLLGFRRAAGTAGRELVPDLATTVPQPTDGGRTYTLRLRRGIRYSNGAPLRASDVPFSVARAISEPAGPARSYFGDLAGVAACSSASHCDLSAGILINDATRTVTFHLSRPDPDFVDTLALPFADIVPTGTPSPTSGVLPPGTGPYKASSYPVQSGSHTSLTLVRNPYFRQWSAVAQPRGNPDAIHWALGVPVVREVARVDRGTLDAIYDSGGIPRSAVRDMALHHASQLHLFPLPGISALATNVQTAPFNNPLARRALAFAIDRRRVRDVSGEDIGGQITCQLLPPGFPGYKPYCPYAPSHPDIPHARQLVGQSGTRGERVVLDDSRGEPAADRYLLQMLRAIGYRAQLRLHQDVYSFVTTTTQPVQLYPTLWFADYPSPDDFLSPLFTCAAYIPHSLASSNVSRYCSLRMDLRINAAARLDRIAPLRANHAWTAIDHTLVRQAPWIPEYTPTGLDFLSQRVGGWQENPTLGLLTDQLWVR